jgi:glycosyltransferase involved in cell wall biosynthesis
MPWQFMAHGTRIREILLEEKPDLIEVCDKYFLSLMAVMIRKHSFKKLGRPMLVHFSCERMDDNVGAFVSRGRVGKWLARRLMGNYNVALYDFYVANSRYTAGEYFESTNESENPGRSKAVFNACWRFFRAAPLPLKDRIFVCSRGGTDSIFSTANISDDFRREFIQEIGLDQETKILFYAGRISPEKNINLLIETMEQLQSGPDTYHLVVAGGGPKAEWFAEECRKRIPGFVTILGHLTDKQKLAKLYSNCDVFVHPNPREPFGIGPLEAMASGTPVVAPNSGGILSYATPENSWLCSPTGVEFAAAVREICGDRELTRLKVQNALGTVRENGWEESNKEIFDVYEKMIERFRQENSSFDYIENPKDIDFTQLLDS